MIKEDNFESKPEEPRQDQNLKPQANGFLVFSGDAEESSIADLEAKLFGIVRTNFQQQTLTDSDFVPLKTGTGVKLIRNGPKHIMDAEQYEPLYVPQENILEDCLRREAERVAHQENLMNRVVFDSVDPAPNSSQVEPVSENEQLNNQESEEDHQIVTSVCDNDQNLPQYYQPKASDDYTLVFESRFESGNLRRAIQVYEFEYDLILKPDYNTRGHTQWYYFRVQNTRPDRTYRFNIINLLKPDSLYNHGMCPLMYSEIEAKKFGKGWHRAGRDVCYYQNSMKRKTVGHYYTLTFSVKFPYEQDTVFFAHCYPYTYSELQRYLGKLEAHPTKKLRFRRRTLCQTLAGNNCDMLLITTFGSDPESIKQRKGVVISSRVHPGESAAQYMMKGIIDYLVGPSLGARILRDNFVFKIIPMLNPDGVINGNTRCSLAGVDLNRQWIEPSKKLHPTIYYTKMMMKKFQDDREVFLFCDIHGHSRKKNIFMYGNSGKNDKYKERIFPFLLEKQAQTFNFADCSFSVQKAKESTARVVVWKELAIQNSYTLEASFCGSDFGRYSDLHFNTDMLQDIGHRFCETILEYCQPDPLKFKVILEEIEGIVNNMSQTSGTGPIQDEGQPPVQVGILEQQLGTINERFNKDEDSNADSDFSGEEGTPKNGMKTQVASGQGDIQFSQAASGMPVSSKEESKMQPAGIGALQQLKLKPLKGVGLVQNEQKIGERVSAAAVSNTGAKKKKESTIKKKKK